MELLAALCIRPGVTAIIGSGGKTTLLYALARVLSADARVLVCTTTHILPPEHMPVLLCPSESALRAALQAQSPVCTASGVDTLSDVQVGGEGTDAGAGRHDDSAWNCCQCHCSGADSHTDAGKEGRRQHL